MGAKPTLIHQKRCSLVVIVHHRVLDGVDRKYSQKKPKVLTELDAVETPWLEGIMAQAPSAVSVWQISR